MTAISRKELRDTIRLRGDYTNVRRFSTTFLNGLIQSAFNDFWRIVNEAHQGWWDTQGTVTTAVGVAYVALPTDAKVVQGVDRLDGGEYEPMGQIGIGDRNRWGAGNGKPVAYRLSARGIELNQPADGAYTLRVMYTPKPPQLTENEAREWFDGWENYIYEHVLLALDSREKMPLGDRLKKLEIAEAALRASTNARRQQEPEYLVLREYSDLDPFGELL